MIGKLRGLLIEKYPEYIILEVNSIGYIVYVTQKILTKYKLNYILSLFIESRVCENNIQLYGFETREEKSLVHKLIRVKGISMRIAMNLLSASSTQEIISAITTENKAALKVNGLGSKLLNRLISELKEELLHESQPFFNAASCLSNTQVLEEAVQALIQLGYAAAKARQLVTRVYDRQSNTATLVQQALKQSYHEKK